MEFKNTLSVLQSHTSEINKILERLEETEQIKIIDLDLILEKLRSVYDVVNDMRNEVQSINKSVETIPADQDKLQDEKRIVNLSPESEDSVRAEQKVETKTPASDEKEDFQPEKKFDKQKTINKEPVLSDRFKSDSPTLNEEIGSQTKRDDISTQFKADPIVSLTGAIGLNEKFELINELFDGDKNKFDQTMKVLNSSSSFVEAYSYLEENFEWDMENPYVQRILELIRRKLIVRRNEQ